MCHRRKKILLRDSKGSTLSAEQDKLDAFSIPNLDSKATCETQPSNHPARRRSLASKRLSLWRTAFDEVPLKSANSSPLVPYNLKSIRRFNSESVSRPFVTQRCRKWRNNACRSKDTSPANIVNVSPSK